MRPNRLPAREAAQHLRLLALDVDGTLTDGSIWIGTQGEVMKAFSVRDGFGLTLLREAGLELAIITGRRSAIVQARADELRIRHVVQGAQDKGAALIALCERLSIEPRQAAFMGDDWPDLPAMTLAGLALAPADATLAVKEQADWVSTRRAGDGAVREFAEWWLARRGLLADLLARYRNGGAASGSPTRPPNIA